MMTEINSIRKTALELANSFEGDPQEIVARALVYADFLVGDPPVAEPVPQQATPASEGSKSSRRSRKPSSNAPSSETPSTPAPAAAPNDMFDAPSAASRAPAAAPVPPTGVAKSPSEKPPSVEEVRAKLVQIQTKLENKDKAIALLAKFTTGGEKTLGKLPVAQHAALIAAATRILERGESFDDVLASLA